MREWARLIEVGMLDSANFIDELYYRLLVQEDYDSTLALLTEAFGAHAGGVFLINKNDTKIMAGSGLNPDTFGSYHGDLNSQDYIVPALKSHDGDKVFTASGIVSLNETMKTDYYVAIDAPSDIYDKLCFHVVSPEQQLGVALYRDRKREFTRGDLADAQKLYPEIARCFRLLQRKAAATNESLLIEGLTAREIEIVTLLRANNDYKAIAAITQISSNTLKWHMKNVFQKFEVSTLAELLVKIRR